MNISALEAYRNKAASDEQFWFAAYKDAADPQDVNDFGWIYAHVKELREKLDNVIEARIR